MGGGVGCASATVGVAGSSCCWLALMEMFGMWAAVAPPGDAALLMCEALAVGGGGGGAPPGGE